MNREAVEWLERDYDKSLELFEDGEEDGLIYMRAEGANEHVYQRGTSYCVRPMFEVI
jgi:hypothetical protein